MGGPDGGNAGRGGHVIFRAVSNINTLIDFRYQQHFKAKRGGDGQGRMKSGAKGKDLIIKVPVGTQIMSDDQLVELADFTEEGQEVTLAKGGDGGFGNAHFKSSVNQAPRRITQGQPGEEYWVRLKLKLISDIGIMGLPNAGKSTFLSVVSRAKPKIADYPFTTLVPNLGVAYIDEKEMVLADIPGLIEGAHEGVGLGDRFLKHIERCYALLHLIDITAEDVVASYQTIRKELEKYSSTLAEKKEVIALNKCDALQEDEIQEKQKKLEKATGKKIYVISAVGRKNIDEVLRGLGSVVDHPRQDQD